MASCLAVLFWVSAVEAGTYAPQEGQPGTTATPGSSASFVEWANAATIIQGPNADALSQYPVSNAVNSMGTIPLGVSTDQSGDIVSLGNGGVITVSFRQPITDAPGPDFAVFSNGFISGSSAADMYSKLAFVSVSSDDLNFFSFPSVSLSPNPISEYGLFDPTNLYDIAGKYGQDYGVPFSLSELAGDVGLDLNEVRYVRITDVVGNGTTKDSLGDPVYAIYPSTGFNLAGVGVISDISQVPEPATSVLFAIAGLFLLPVALRRRILAARDLYGLRAPARCFLHDGGSR
jgi:hypothetical protein